MENPIHIELWNKCLEVIRSQVKESTFETWFKVIEPHSYDPKSNTIKVLVPNIFTAEWIEENYIKELKSAIIRCLGPDGRLEYGVKITNKPVNKANIGLLNHQENIPFKNDNKILSLFEDSANLNPNYTFANFIEGDCNKLARNVGIAVSQKPGLNSFNPFMIYGGAGLGKTHLLQAIGNQIRKQHKDKSIFYIDSTRFVQLFTDYLSSNKMNEFTGFFLSIDVLIIDDIQFFSNKGKTQEIFFQIFNHLHQNNKQIVMSCDRPPKDLEGLEERLLSRFKWGIFADLQMPDLETKIAIIKNKMQNEGMIIPDDVIEYIAYSVDTSVRELEGVLLSLFARATFNKVDINLELAKQVLKDVIRDIETDVNVDYIQKCVAEYFKIPLEELKGKSRKKEIVIPRHIAMYLTKEYTSMTLKNIGYHYGKRDHTTVLNAVSAVNDLISTDKNIFHAVEELKKKLKIKQN